MATTTLLKWSLALGLLASHALAGKLLGSSFGVPGDNATYDFVVVGGGNAGLAVAARLIEQNAGTVAIVEAGSFYEISNSNYSQVPATDGYFSGKGANDWQPLVDWGYMTTSQAVSIFQRSLAHQCMSRWFVDKSNYREH